MASKRIIITLSEEDKLWIDCYSQAQKSPSRKQSVRVWEDCARAKADQLIKNYWRKLQVTGIRVTA